ncbi:PP1c_bdg domain-containing protein [Caerostris extrusa]|uniref:Protein DP71L n=1 Tax=Caerostris extrusa TaxID=172846 RepID=A0AAV4XDV0_CAEEX|nr:PP1c_bdg domain-containing protein [Caerostris extrusa]
MPIKPTLMPRHYIYKRPFTVGNASRLESYSSKMKKLTKGSKKKFHHKKTRKNVRKKSPNFGNNPKSKRKKLEKMSSVVSGVSSSQMYQESESDSWYTTDTSCIDSDSSCGINKTHSAKDNEVVHSNVSTFLIAVQSDDHDDSDWDDNSDSDTLNETSDFFITCSSKASDAFNVDEVRECSSEDACDSDDSSNSMDNRTCYDKNSLKPYSCTSTFVIPLDSDSDDDSDWDEASDSEWSADDLDFSFPGLYLDNLNSTPKTITSIFTLDDDSQTNPFLLEVNRKWNEANMEIEKKSKSSRKVSFAPEEKLVQVLEVENYNRKGEWEIYALERVRFKNRIDELEKVISPCLSKEHRQKVFQKICEAQ